MVEFVLSAVIDIINSGTKIRHSNKNVLFQCKNNFNNN
jgi:hypothetical protein